MSEVTDAAASRFSSDAWLAETLALPVYKVAAVGAQTGDALRGELERLAAGGNAFFYAKVPTADVPASLALQHGGFGVVDTAVTFAWREQALGAPGSFDVSAVRPDQGEAVAAIAETCFVWSRFHLDPKIPRAAANRVKRCWIENYISGKRGAALYVATTGGAVAGFLAVIEAASEGRTVAAIDLIGVSAEHQHHGVGSALVHAFVRDWRERVSELRVGTQAANIRSLRFYERNGFRIAESSYVLHAHVRDGRVWQ
jgi:dTDP-4-amino-4,6-dideoxy-D-galactose acyltransferase